MGTIKTVKLSAKTYDEARQILGDLLVNDFDDGDKATVEFPDGTTVVYEFKERWEDKSGEVIDFKILPED